MFKKYTCINVKFIALILMISLCALLIFIMNDFISDSNFPIDTTDFEPLNVNYSLLHELGTSLSQKNLIFIGDVHGAFDELSTLIETLDYNPLKDHLIFVGDLVAKGPESIKVVELARSLGASCVRGNHDDKLLRWKNYLNSLEAQGIELDKYVKQMNLPVKKSEYVHLARQLSSEHYEFLLSCPMILNIPEHDIIVVHAGLLPNVPFSKQEPFDIMNMRNIKKNGKPTKSKKEGQAWTIDWNNAQERSSSPKTVIYGHDSSRGLNLKPYSFGLDSRCVHGGELSALKWNEKGILSVRCKQYID